MSVGVLSVMHQAKDVVARIIDRLNQLKLSEDTAIKIKKKLDYFEKVIRKIELHLKQDGEREEINQFLAHLEKARQSCDDILENHEKPVITRLVISSTADISKLRNIEAELENASSKLKLFIASSHLLKFCDVADLQNERLAEISASQENSKAGVHIVQDNSVTLPSAPLGLTLHEDKNKLVLSWEPSKGIVDEYEICYDERNECIMPVGIVESVGLESPSVQPGNVYTMKVRGVNKGGKGEWSNVVTGQITKPSPQKPEIANLLFRSTMATVTVKVAEAICSTESPVTCVEVSYASTASTVFTIREFTIEPGNATYTFTVSELQPDSKYKFIVRSKNAEGWSKPSDPREGNTLLLPLLPAKPNPPVIKVCTPTTVKLEATAPESTCSINSPIVAWRVSGYSESKQVLDKDYPKKEKDFMEKCSSLNIADLDRNQEYKLKLFAKNENGWSEPSEAFKIHIAMPPPPKNVRVSSYRTHSLVKIRWNAPDSILVTRYEIAKTTRQGVYCNYKQPFVVPANKFSATFTELRQRTQYYFKVRACNDRFTSDWSNEIEVKTRIHKGIKAAISPVVWALTTVTAPISAAVKVGELAGKSINEGGSNKATVAAGTAGGAVGGLVAGAVGAPVVGGMWTHYFVHGMDELSDQSDDEDAAIIED